MEKPDKSQGVRVIDVVFIGPFLIASAFIIGIKTPWGQVMLFIGIATIIYNARNFLLNR